VIHSIPIPNLHDILLLPPKGSSSTSTSTTTTCHERYRTRMEGDTNDPLCIDIDLRDMCWNDALSILSIASTPKTTDFLHLSFFLHIINITIIIHKIIIPINTTFNTKINTIIIIIKIKIITKIITNRSSPRISYRNNILHLQIVRGDTSSRIISTPFPW